MGRERAGNRTPGPLRALGVLLVAAGFLLPGSTGGARSAESVPPPDPTFVEEWPGGSAPPAPSARKPAAGADAAGGSEEDGSFPRVSGEFRVLCYHQFGSQPEDGKALFRIPTWEFRWQMNHLRELGFTPVSLDDVRAFYAGGKPLPERAVLLAFDDGFRDIHREAFPILKGMGWKGVLFLYTDFLAWGGAALRHGEIREMREAGFELGSHGKAHLNLGKIKETRPLEEYRRLLEEELGASARYLVEHFGDTHTAFAYPYGVYNDDLEAELERFGYNLAFTIDRGPNDATVHPLRLRRYLVTYYTKRETFRKWLAEGVLHLRHKGPGEGETVWEKRPLISAEVADDVDPATLKIRIGERELPFEWVPPARLVRAPLRFDLREGGHQLTVTATDTSGRERVYSWYFRVRHRPGMGED